MKNATKKETKSEAAKRKLRNAKRRAKRAAKANQRACFSEEAIKLATVKPGSIVHVTANGFMIEEPRVEVGPAPGFEKVEQMLNDRIDAVRYGATMDNSHFKVFKENGGVSNSSSLFDFCNKHFADEQVAPTAQRSEMQVAIEAIFAAIDSLENQHHRLSDKLLDVVRPIAPSPQCQAAQETKSPESELAQRLTLIAKRINSAVDSVADLNSRIML